MDTLTDQLTHCSTLTLRRDEVMHRHAPITAAGPSTGPVDGATRIELSVLRAYDRGLSLREIERLTGVGRMSVHVIARRFGRPARRPRMRSHRQALHEAIVAAIIAGASTGRIANDIGVSTRAIRAHLIKHPDDRLGRCGLGHWRGATSTDCPGCRVPRGPHARS